jgi:hypothetical protein
MGQHKKPFSLFAANLGEIHVNTCTEPRSNRKRHASDLLLRRWAEELILPYDNLRTDVDATVEVDHVIVDKTEAAG